MTFHLQIACSNAAFDGDNLGPELGCILSTLVRDMFRGPVETDRNVPLFDTNGNRVGHYAFHQEAA
jgi:hypothetical protein